LALVPLTQQFADALTAYTATGDAVLEKAENCLLDFFASCYATQNFPWVRQVQQVARTNSGMSSGGAALIGTPYRVSVQDAALANAVAGHSLVRDDMHLGSVSHLGVVVIPAALALAAEYTATGRQFLEAIICGYEAAGRLGAMLMDVETAKVMRPTGLIGAFGTAATAAKLARLDPNKTAQALGFAANSITGFNEWATWGSDDMYFHPGIAVRNGLTAMLLAGEGAVAADGALDGHAGLFAAMHKSLPEPANLPFSNTEEILRVFFKQVPACNYAQTAAQAARRVKETHAPDLVDISAITACVPHAAAHYPGCDYAGPFNSILQARMSIHFNVASALIHGDFHDSHYRDFGNADVAVLAEKVSVVIDAALTADYPGKQGAVVSVSSGRGEVFSESLDDVIAASSKEISERYLDAAGSVIGSAAANELQQVILNLSESADISALAQLPEPIKDL
jgi:2-methylcitrate dehydratase PrpD